MKRIASAIAALLLIFGLLNSVTVIAEGDCSHEYTARLLAADCSHPERTEYTCALCGDTYTVNTVDAPAPTSFSLVLRTSEKNGKVTLTGTLYNNPGLVGARVSVYFDPEVLTFSSYTNGTVFTDDQYVMGVTPQSDHITLYSEVDINSTPVKRNGLYFTFVFDVAAEGDYGIYATSARGDMSGWDSATNKTSSYTLNIVNLQGKEKLGDHSFGEYVTETEPTFDSEGTAVSTCTICGERQEKSVAALVHWKKGDLNNDGKVNSIDVNLVTRTIIYGTENVYVNDAADMNLDGHVNAVDGNLICRLLVGG